MPKNSIPVSAALACALLLSAGACGPKSVGSEAIAALGTYVSEASAGQEAPSSGEGSLWVNHGRGSNLFRDFKAREVNDIVTIRVVETTLASTSADAKTSKDSSVSAEIGNLAGLERRIKELPNLVNAKSSSSFEGAGSTSRSTSLRTNLAARVVKVLPNGYLVVEGVREIRLNNENQTIFVTGVVREREDAIEARDIALDLRGDKGAGKIQADRRQLRRWDRCPSACRGRGL